MGVQPVEETIIIPLSVAKVIASWPNDCPKHWVAGDELTAQEADALMQVRIAYEQQIPQQSQQPMKGKDNGKD